MEKRRVIAVVFDLDGTLIDSARAIQAVGDRLLADHGLAALSAEETRSFIGAGAAKFVERAFAARSVADPGAVAAAVERFQIYYREADPLEHNTPMPGAAAAMDALAAAGCPLGLCTNKPEAPTRSVVGALGWADRFAALVAGDTLAVRKPDPAPLQEVGRLLGGGPLVFVGDSEVDAETAERAARPFLLYTEGYRKAPVEALPRSAAFSDFAELPALVEAVAAGSMR